MENSIKMDISILLTMLINIEAKMTAFIQTTQDEQAIKQIEKLSNEVRSGLMQYYEDKFPGTIK